MEWECRCRLKRSDLSTSDGGDTGEGPSEVPPGRRACYVE